MVYDLVTSPLDQLAVEESKRNHLIRMVVYIYTFFFFLSILCNILLEKHKKVVAYSCNIFVHDMYWLMVILENLFYVPNLN